MAVGFDMAFIVGVGVTKTLRVTVFLQPKAFAPLTVYVVLTVGVEVIVPPTIGPGNQV